MTRPRPAVRSVAGAAAVGLLLVGCGGGSGEDQASGGGSEVTVTNCDTKETFPSPAERMYVADNGNMTAMLLELGAGDQITGVTGLSDGKDMLASVYGAEVVDGLELVSEDRPTMETVVAQDPDVMVTGWGYGYRDENKLTPDTLKERDIAPYTLTESCRQQDEERGVMPPWEALEADMDNLGQIAGREDEADEFSSDLKARLEALEDAPQPSTAPTVFLFDSGTKEIYTSGSFGGPQAVIEAAGAKNATADLKDSWTEVSWERLVSSEPDYIAFVDYPGQTFEEKVKVLESNPATKNLPAVKEERFLNIPIAAWTSGPLNIDAAEQLRQGLEEHDLVPASDIEPEHDLQPKARE